MRSILILFVLVLTSCTRVEPKMTVISNKEKFVIENFAKKLLSSPIRDIVIYGSITIMVDGMV